MTRHLNADDNAACNDPALDPNWWFPEPENAGRTAGSPADKLVILNSVEAMEICTTCPLFANGKCLEYAMSDTTTIDYGIFAGTLPMERREAVGSYAETAGVIYQRRIRKAADTKGLIPPLIPRRERPKSSYLDYFINTLSR
jgi:hypothetical protein